ncbi:MAG: sulfur carrier protein ThiS [Planctomycetes bacterium]|nr:sulfur carrier protein ThiS [Planctomycetota bacterium]
MKLTINGEPCELTDGKTVRQMIEDLGFKGRAVAVEVNRKVVPKKQHETTALRDGDAVEVVTLVGGG